jgi:transcription termination factor Rho
VEHISRKLEYICIYVLKHDLNSRRLLELRNMAKSLGIRYIKRYNKSELINEIINAEEQLKIKRGNKNSLEIFPFNDAIFSKPKKERVKKIKLLLREDY